MRRWVWLNRWVGVIIFGFPVAAGVVAVAATAARFGFTSVAAGLPLLVVAIPGVLWFLYLRSSGKRFRPLTWCVALAASLLVLASSPIGLWTWPCLGVLLSELTRLAVVASSHRSRTSIKLPNGASVRRGSAR